MRLFLLLTSVFFVFTSTAQQGNWTAQIHRPDGNNIVFTFDWKTENGKPVWYIKNAAEKIKVQNITAAGDSLIIQMPVFESQFRVVVAKSMISGVWIKRGAVKTQVLPFNATPGNNRFASGGNPAKNISGRWAVTFGEGAEAESSVAEFVQKGNLLSGTFLNASGDYRYLEGIVTKDSLLLSGFDGGHAFLFKAVIKDDNTISDGKFYSGGSGKENWTAVKNADAKLATESVAMFVKAGQEKLNFTFKNLEGKPLSINDDRFKNKVVIIQIMGSWCPNCMDETAFLSEYYNKNKQRGVEVIALAYEYTTDWQRSLNSLKKFQQRFNVQYPILNTEVTVGDSLKTEKTLPQVTNIKSFPSSIILDKKGKIRKLDTEFNGPATGVHYAEYKKEFEQTVNNLLKEN
ncbi:TlpA disulfide reductase family protein [Ferruginibacter paludis]|uniref:peroxiredoxin family protein n=1 Tax=Ferruginibacter paludis TaxID=1310417 RepID=UPI0025B5880C|nr:TlpA disulfide reductase family protein [Ferruginibacter paludis]MDN3658995.1 TlpA disulfide reductase family protein [Ferruginibacter paludis]